MAITESIQQQPLVSFIITYYNLPVDLLCSCIDSILALSLSPEEREIIVIDDGSDLSPMNDLLKYGDDIIYVRQKNKGVSAARNIAMDMAKGQFIQLIDGDDCLLSEPYNFCLDTLRGHRDADIITFDFTHKAAHAATSFNPPIKKSGTELMRSQNIKGSSCCYLFSKAVRSQLAFTPDLAYGEDEEFTAQLLIRAEVVYITDVQAYLYRERTTSATHLADEDSIETRLSHNMDMILRLNKLADVRPYSERIALQRRIAQLTMDYIYNTIQLTRSEKKLNETISQLRKDGLFPLPDRPYSTKYTWFRRLSNNAIGRKLLLTTIPLMKKER